VKVEGFFNFAIRATVMCPCRVSAFAVNVIRVQCFNKFQHNFFRLFIIIEATTETLFEGRQTDEFISVINQIHAQIFVLQ